ncbi:hypothetical protein D0Y65_017115 [Glycine soja]|uniref:Uncharacterized protein n=1 Tax=Glycine soja TaxID=3848 RepID=A0A445JTE2_GLYSO|nr:hypothetical protein D0Y65_017115 [Glycine soja]
MTKTSSVKLAEAEDDVYQCRFDLKESENCSFLTTTSKVQRTLDHNLAAIYGKKLFSKRKRDAVKFQQLSDLMRTQMYWMKITPKYVMG